MGHVIVYCVGWVLDRAPRTKETLSDFFFLIIDHSKWDITVWYRVTQYPKVFHELMGDQRTPGFWGVIAWYQSIGMPLPRA